MMKDKDKCYDKLFEDNKNIFLLIDDKTQNIVKANQAACDFYHYTYEELTALKISDLNLLDDEEIKAEMEKAAFQKRQYFNFLHRLKDGQIRRVEVNNTPIVVNDRNCIFSIIMDARDKYRQDRMITDFFFESPEAMAIIDEENRVLSINHSFTQLFGFTFEELTGKPISDFITTDLSSGDASLNFKEVMRGKVINKNIVRKTKSEKLIDVNLIATPYTIGNEVVGSLLIYRDICAQVKTLNELAALKNAQDRELRESREQLQLILDSTAEGIYGLDLNGVCTFCNASCLNMLGYSSQNELLGVNIHETIYHSDKFGNKRPADNCKIAEGFKEGRGVHVEEEVFWKKDGTSLDVSYSSYPEYKNGAVVGSVVTFLDITERKKNEAHLNYLLYHDALTGLYNRKFFENALIKEDTETNLPVSMIYGDVNGLKLTNDIFGHEVGDELIKKAAELIRKFCREQDIVARIGGDEFAVMMPKTDRDTALKIIGRIKQEMAKEQLLAIKCSISLGVETKTGKAEDINRTLEAAETVMYKEKTLNRTKVNIELVQTVIATLHNKHPYEKRHSEQVSELCGKIGAELGLSDTEIRKLKDAGYLHDIGKVVFDEDAIVTKYLQKNGKELHQHPIIGYRILNLFDETLDLADGVLFHHEYWNGTGYPKGIKGKEIPLIARILAVAEAYDSLTYPAKSDFGHQEAISEIKNLSGIKFDPEVADAFVRMMIK